MPPAMHLDQLIEIDTPESLLPRLSERAELTVLGHDHPALGGHMRSAHTRARSPACPAIPWWRYLAAGRREPTTAAQ